ncbi:putative bifunctional diguanylate cyclase/phosphodiesterase [Comamonas aquatilis]|uniref:putative bifunctional diguanylate cyclase/phosphodiesterase n=1 Tax=Comamonas aquatilis TaxID=1778406 RepID=UPI0039EDEBA6
MQRFFVEAKNRVSMRRMLWFACLWMSALGLVTAAASLISPRISWGDVLLFLLLIPIAAMAMTLARLRRWDVAMVIFVWGNWLWVAAAAGWSGGMDSKAVMALPVWMVITAWLLGFAHTLVMLVLSVALLLLFWALDHLGISQLPAEQILGAAGLFYVLGMLGLAVAATLMARASLGRQALKSMEILRSLEQSQQELRKFHRAVEQSPESIVITDTHLQVVYVNDAFLARTGYSRGEVLGQPTELVSTMGLDRNKRQRALAELLAGRIWRSEMTNRTRNGAALRESVLVAPIRSPQGEIVNYVELKQDLSERVDAARRIHDLVYLDVLTGLANRHSLALKVKALSRANKAAASWHGLMLVDVDRFSSFNDVHGMQHGDAVLRAFALRLVEQLPEGVLIARISRAEFAVLFESAGDSIEAVQALLVSEAGALQKSLQKPLSIMNSSESEAISCSIGCAVLELEQGAPEGNDVLRFAGVALNEAKRSGPGNMALFDPRMAELAHRRFRIAKDLRAGIPAGQLRMYVQAQANHEGVCVGGEVLVRWQHPQWGLVGPADFIAVAEESQLIVQLGDWVLRQACALLAQAEFAAHGLRLSVNVSAIQFAHADFVSTLKSILADSGASPERLTLEITEGVLMRDVDVARARLHELRALGLEIALDDFGTGYSSIASLKHLPIQELKIDQSFIRGSHVSEIDAALVEAIVRMAARLQLRVVAEGVELAAQARLLKAWNPAIVLQGLYYGKAQPVEDWLPMVLGHRPPSPDQGPQATIEGLRL